MRTRTAYRSAIRVALAAAFLLVWLSLGVGIIGKDGDPAKAILDNFARHVEAKD